MHNRDAVDMGRLLCRRRVRQRIFSKMADDWSGENMKKGLEEFAAGSAKRSNK